MNLCCICDEPEDVCECLMCPHCESSDCDGADGYACPNHCYRCRDMLDNCDCEEPLSGYNETDEEMLAIAKSERIG